MPKDFRQQTLMRLAGQKDHDFELCRGDYRAVVGDGDEVQN